MYFLDRFDVLMSKIILKKWKNIIGMYFDMKSYLKNTRNHTIKHDGIKWFKSVHGDAALTNHRSVLKLLASSGSSLLVQEFCPWWCCHSEAPICYQAPGFIYIYTVYIYFVWPVKLICGGWFFPSESLGGSFFFNPACSGQLICITINFWIHWISYKPNKYIRHRENDRCA